ncbi:MAG: DUF4293 family protein [Bacteroidales bacterium]
MIQRVQSLFLLAVISLQFSMLFVNMATIGEESIKYTNFVHLTIMIVVTLLLSFFTLFLYRHRVLQLRLSVINIVILLGLQGLIFWSLFKRPQEAFFSVSTTAVFPVVSAILTILAFRYIARDIAMLKATSRLR